MQISLFYFKTCKTYCHSTNTSKTLNNHMNLKIKLKKQEMNELNYSNALWNCFEFQIA